MKTIFTSIILFTAAACLGQTEFRTGTNALSYSTISSLVQLDDGSFVGVGYAEQDNAIGNFVTGYAYLVKLNAAGRLVAAKGIGTSGNFSDAYKIIKTSDGNLAVAAELNYQFTLLKVDTNLNTLWNHQYNFTPASGDQSYAVSLLQTTDGGYLVAGSALVHDGSNNELTAGIVMKTDANGNASWTKQYFNIVISFAPEKDINDIVQTKDGNYVFVVHSYNNNAASLGDSIHLVKIDGTGSIIWSEYIAPPPSNLQQVPISLMEDDRGNLVIGGRIFQAGNPYPLIIKLDANGNIKWSRLSNSTYDYGVGVAEDADGYYILSGQESDPSYSYSQTALIRMDSTGGTTPADYTYTVPGADDYFNYMTKTNDGGWVLGGEIYSNSSNPDFFDYGLIYKLNSGLASCGNGGVSYDLTFLDAALSAGTETIPSYDITAPSPTNTIDSIALTGDSNFCSTGVMPLQLLSFNARLQNNTVDLQWQTTNEVNTSYFEIERSGDGNKFSSIGKINASGNSAAVKNYSFTDASPDEGENYYRLKMVDIDGKSTYSNVVSININSVNTALRIYPNPATDVLNIRLPFAGKAEIKIYDVSGRIVSQQQVVANGNTSQIDISKLTHGMYYLRMTTNGNTQTASFAKE